MEGARIGGAPGAVVGGLLGSALGTLKPGGSMGENRAAKWLQDKLPSVFQDEKTAGEQLAKGAEKQAASPVDSKNMPQDKRHDAYMKEVQARDKQAKNASPFCILEYVW